MIPKKTRPKRPLARPVSLKLLPTRFPVVGIGASAGGLEAYKQLLGGLPTDTGMAFVLIQHLDPKHESLSAEILSRATQMTVREVTDGVRIEPDHVYVIPPNTELRISLGVLNLTPRGNDRSPHFVIDAFLQSLADEQGELAVGIILSGTGSDGTDGLTAIKANGGITFAQDLKSAKFDGMPHSAVSSGAVDLAMTPAKIAQELGRLASRLKNRPALDESGTDLSPLTKIFMLIKQQCHVDFAEYKSSTIRRRIERRMLIHRSKNLEVYAKALAQEPEEVKALFADILIHVTSFFRDPEAYDTLKKEAFPKLSSELGLRLWVAGCSTGEEAYSLAISLLEYLGERASQVPIQIFGTDISESAIQRARQGEYPESISKNVSPERLKRYFVKLDAGGYRISKAVRDLCLFSRHDLTRDPPFAKIDLISCRNLLIYFSPALQKHVIPIFHYALVPNGILWLGKSETIGEFSALFGLVDRNGKVYSKIHTGIAAGFRFPPNTYVAGAKEPERKVTEFRKPVTDLQQQTERAIQAEYPGVLINADLEVIQFRGRTVPFLEPAPGPPGNLLMKMARPEIHSDLRLAIQAAKDTGISVRRTGLSFREGTQIRSFNLKVVPVKPPSASEKRHYLVLFEDASHSDAPIESSTKAPYRLPRQHAETDRYVSQLERELTALKDDQLVLAGRFESTQEDASAANEELQSANEELQSTNEELETAKEELQSGNEELTTVNDELQIRNQELNQLNNDLINLLGSVEIPILMLGNDHRIRRFTALAGKVLNLLPTDVGRPIGDLRLTFTAPGFVLDLNEVVRDVIQTQSLKEIEVQNSEGHWFRLQARPYRTIDGITDGAVLALVDVNAFKASLKEVRAARTEAEQANRAKDLFLATLSHELRTPLTTILSWSQLLRSGKLSPGKTKRAAEMIEESGRSQAQLINDLLDVSRIITGKFSLEIREVDLAIVAEAAIESVRSSAEGKGIAIVSKLNPEPEVGFVRADPDRLQQVIWNLLSNAVKFSELESTITVSLDRVDGQGGKSAMARVQVRDSGKGIHAEFLPHMFDRFSQEDSSSVRFHGGMGLGLAIVRNLVELQGGTVQAESSGEGTGSVFTVLMPLTPEMKLVSSRREVSQLGDGRRRECRLDDIRVLIVDDDAMAREAFSEILASAGAKTQLAGSVQEALKRFTLFKPHLVLTDIAMPGEDGYALLRKIRAVGEKKGGGVPCIALTAYAGAAVRMRALDVGFQAHLDKPVDSQKLVETVFKLTEPGKHRD